MKTYTINKNGTSIVASTYGAELVSFKKDGFEYIWQGDEKYWKGQNPILFPILCSLKNDMAEFEGKIINLPKHGFARKSEFTLVSLDDTSVTLSLKSSRETLAKYPFEFEFIVTHSVDEGSFTTTYEVVNKGSSDMVFQLGAHTGFNIPVAGGDDSFNEHKLVFERSENAVNYKAPTGGLIVNPEGSCDVLSGTDTLHLSYDKFDNDAIILAGLESKSVSLLNTLDKGVKMDISNFSALGIWTPAGKEAPFVCLEPWNGLPAFCNESGKFDEKPFVKILAPGEIYTASCKVEII